MEVQYTLTQEDFWSYRKYRMAHDYFYFPTRFLCFYLLAFALGYVFHHDLALMAAASFIVAFFWFIQDILTTKSQIRKLIARYPYWVMPQGVTLEAQGIDWSTDAGNAKIPWHQFKAIEDNGVYLLFRMRRWRAIIVPKSAFRNSREAQAFWEIAHSYRQNAGSGSDTLPKEETWPPPPRP